MSAHGTTGNPLCQNPIHKPWSEKISGQTSEAERIGKEEELHATDGAKYDVCCVDAAAAQGRS